MKTRFVCMSFTYFVLLSIIFHFHHIYLLYLIYLSLQKATLTNDTKDKEYTPHDLPQRQSVQPQETCSIARRAKRMRSEVSVSPPSGLRHYHVVFCV